MSKDLILITGLHGAKPVNFIFKTTYFAAPDEGGEIEDKGSYIATCPVCGHEFERIFEKYPFCPYCGTKLYWNIKYPVFVND